MSARSRSSRKRSGLITPIPQQASTIWPTFMAQWGIPKKRYAWPCKLDGFKKKICRAFCPLPPSSNVWHFRRQPIPTVCPAPWETPRNSRPRLIERSKLRRLLLRLFSCGIKSSASSRRPLRIMALHNASLFGVNILMLLRPRQMVTYHCCALEVARAAEAENK